MGTVGIGVIGCGFISQAAHLPSLRRVEGAKLIALADVRFKLAKKLAETYRAKPYGSHMDLLEDPDVEAVLVATDKFSHAKIVLDACKAGKHVLVEKPMATTVEDAKAMVNAAKRASVTLMVGYMKRYDLGVEAAKKIVRGAAAPDEIVYARSHIFGGDWICGPTVMPVIRSDEPRPGSPRVYPVPIPEDFRWMAEFLLEQIHDVNLPRFLLGNPISISYAEKRRNCLVALLSYGDYSLVLEGGYAEADFWDENLTIYFRRGWVSVQPPAPLLRNMSAKVLVYRAGRGIESLHCGWEWAFERQIKHFVRCVKTGEEPLSSGRDSYRDIAVVEAILKSAVEHRPVKIRYDL